jgi:hypothetical protein
LSFVFSKKNLSTQNTKHMKKQIVLLTLSIATIISIGSCKKEKKEPTVYIAGSDGAVAKYWKDGTPNLLANFADAYGIVVSGSDVYVSGSDFVGSKITAKYWKNGNAFQLSDGSRQAYANSIAVVNGTVYASGTDGLYRCYWKNGIKIILYDGNPTSDYDSYAKGIAILGNDILVAGYINTTGDALYWKNGTAVILENGKGYNISTSAILTTSTGDVYVAGDVSLDISKNVACYWKNGVRVNCQSGVGQDYTTSMALSGNDVYLAGASKNSSGKNIATYWKNGEAVHLSDGTTDALINGIAVNDKDVYAVGFVYNSNKIKVATYWKNGLAIQLSDGTATAELNAIVLAP